MPRFTILFHDKPGEPHYDLLLEWGDVLRTWAIASPPESDVTLDAQPLPDHRMIYLDYEGEVLGGRGTVEQWDTGQFEIIEETEKRLVVELVGRRIELIATLDVETSRWSFRER